MLMKMRSRMQNQKGFTLVELMVVVVILGILVAIAVPIYRNVQTNAEENACKANIRTLEGAYLIYTADESPGTWPDDYLVGEEEPKCPSDDTAKYTMDPNTLKFDCSYHNFNS